MNYGIGLDCGITSVGYAVMELNEKNEPVRIIRLGSRIFSAAEHPKDGSSLAKPRREARGTRRRLRRHKHRLERIRHLIVEEGILEQDVLNSLYDEPVSDIYQVRMEALDRSVTPEEFARIMIHLAQRRGFKSNRKVDKQDKENGKLLTAVSENQKRMDEKGYRTVGEMMAKDELFAKQKRNKSKSYISTVSRDLIEKEARMIFEAQRNFGNDFAASEIETKYLEILLSQRSFEEGPGVGPHGENKFGGNQIEKMVGHCTFYPEEQRAPKASYSFEYFKLLEAVNHIRIDQNGKKIPLTPEQRKRVIDEAFRKKEVTYLDLRKILELSADSRFVVSGMKYKTVDFVEEEKKTKFKQMQQYHEMRKKFDQLNKGHINSIRTEDLDQVAYALTVYKTDSSIVSYLQNNSELTNQEIEAVLLMPSFSKFGHISVRACRQIIPGLEQGMNYNAACENAGLDFRSHSGNKKGMYLPAKPDIENNLGDITNPVVRRAVSQTIKVINAIIREQGKSPTYVNIELAREMSKSRKERDKIAASNTKNREKNEKIKQEIKDHFGKINPSGMDILKLKLWHDQDGVSPYSQKTMSYERLFEPGYVDVDHIIPYSV